MIDYTLEGSGVGHLILSRPEAKNAMSIAMWEELNEALDALLTMPTLRAIIVSSSVAGTFCPGADIKEFEALSRDAALRHRMRMTMQQTISKLEAVPYPTIVAIEGACIGAGCAIAMACDLRIAGRSAKFGVTPAKLGLIYLKDDVRRLAAAVGHENAKDLLFTGRLIDTVESERMRLAQRICSDGQALDAAENLAHDIIANDGETHASVKSCFSTLVGTGSFDQTAHEQSFEDAFVKPQALKRVRDFLSTRKR